MVNASTKRHRWAVLYEEHGWRDAEGKDIGHIDLVLIRDRTLLLVECKRLQEASWVLLPKPGDVEGRRQFTALLAPRHNSTVRQISWWHYTGEPRSAIAEYCVTKTGGGGHPIESIAADLVRAADALANEERKLVMSYTPHADRIYIPAIVTTAPIWICKVDPAGISLQDGKIPPAADFAEVPWARFTKQLSTVPGRDMPLENLGANWPADLAETKERAVWLINASSLAEFLSEFRLD
jgi:hypothetical protein